MAEHTTYEVREFKTFPGRNIDQMPLLLDANQKGGPFRPLAFYEVMDNQIAAANDGSAADQAFWWTDNYFDSVSASVRHANGNLKIVHYALPLLTMTSKTTLTNNAIAQTEAQYTQLPGIEYEAGKLAEMKLGKDLTPAEARVHPIRLALAKGDPDRLNQWVEAYSKMRSARNQPTNGMGVYMQDVPVSVSGADLRPWYAYGLDDESDARGGYHLVDGLGRLVGERRRRFTNGSDTVQVSLVDLIRFIESQAASKE